MTRAFLFPGQGSQAVGMLKPFIENFDEVQKTFHEASDVLHYDMTQLVLEDKNAELNQTAFTQPALLTASVALWRLFLTKTDNRPEVMAGHSLGEYSALTCADAISFSDALKLVRLRGELMQAAVPEGVGAMAAIVGLDDSEVVELCLDAANGEVLSPANFNSLGQVVVAGARAAVQRAVDAAKPKGAKLAKILPVSVPSHCALMQPMIEAFGQALEECEIKAPSIKILHNVDGANHPDPVLVRKVLKEQLVGSVQWVKTIQEMKTMGVHTLYECGPGKVLINLAKRIDPSFNLKMLGDEALWQTKELLDD